MSFFKPEDFSDLGPPYNDAAWKAAELANAKLEAEGVRVVTNKNATFDRWWPEQNFIHHERNEATHFGLVVGIESITPPEPRPIHLGKLARMVVNALHALPTGVTEEQVDAIHEVLNPINHKEEEAIQSLLKKLKSHREGGKS